MFTAVPWARSASRHSAYDSHVHGMPEANASTGMSSMKPNTSLARDAVGGAHRCERERAVAGDDGGHAVLRHRVDERVPPHRRVVVRVAVDEPGRDERAVGVDDGLAVGPEPRAHLGDHAVADPHVGGARRARPCRRPACRPVPAGLPSWETTLTGASARARRPAAGARGRARGHGRRWARRSGAGRGRGRRSATRSSGCAPRPGSGRGGDRARRRRR